MDELDLSWTEEYTNMFDMPICKPLDQIKICFLYVNTHHRIEKVTCEIYPLELSADGQNSFLSENKLIEIMQQKRQYNERRYKLEEILGYFVTIEPCQLYGYAKDSTGFTDFLKVIPVLGNIHVPSSIFIFHSCNSIWFLFREMTLIQPSVIPLLRSCLKSNCIERKKTYKRVKIIDHYKDNKKFTSKNRS